MFKELGVKGSLRRHNADQHQTFWDNILVTVFDSKSGFSQSDSCWSNVLGCERSFSTRSLSPLCVLWFWPTRVWRPLSGDCVCRTSFITSRLYLLFILFDFILFLAIGADTMIPFLFWQLFHFFRNWSTEGLFRFLGSQSMRTTVFGWMFLDFWQFSFWVFNSVVVQKHPALVSPVHWLLVPWVWRWTAALSLWHLWVARGNRDELQQIELPHQDASWVTCIRCTCSSVIKSVF